MSYFEEEQYALVYYLEHGKPGPVLRQIAEDRILELEFKKQSIEPLKYSPVIIPIPRVEWEDCLTVGDYHPILQ